MLDMNPVKIDHSIKLNKKVTEAVHSHGFDHYLFIFLYTSCSRTREYLKGTNTNPRSWDKQRCRYETGTLAELQRAKRGRDGERQTRREDQPNTRQLCSKNRNGVGTQEFHSRYPPAKRRSSPLRFASLCSGALTSFLTRGGPWHSQNSWVKYKLTKNTLTHTHGLHRLYVWEH